MGEGYILHYDDDYLGWRMSNMDELYFINKFVVPFTPNINKYTIIQQTLNCFNVFKQFIKKYFSNYAYEYKTKI